MKRTLLTILAVLLAVTVLPAQGRKRKPVKAPEPVPVIAPADSLVRVLQAENALSLSAMAAQVTVVATKKVSRADFQFWCGPLGDGQWAADGNWYPRETAEIILSLPAENGRRAIVRSAPRDTAWSCPEPVFAEEMTLGNALFPQVSPDGRRLYFAADSLFGMGGYDLYVATWDPTKKAWGYVQNLGFPYNSAGNDLFFCDLPDGRYSLLVSDRDCGADEVTIYVLRQEVTLQRAVTPEEAAKLVHLAVTAPDGGYLFVKQLSRPAPVLKFEEKNSPAKGFTEEFKLVK